MGGLRIRWQAAAKGAGALIVTAIALRLLPPALEPGPPAPLAADVGLPRVSVSSRPAPLPTPRVGISPGRALGSPAKAPRRASRRRAKHPQGPARPPRAQSPASAPPATAETAPAPETAAPTAPAAPIAPPDDGSIEFAPH